VLTGAVTSRSVGADEPELLAGVRATVDHVDRAVHERGVVRRQERDRGGDLVGLRQRQPSLESHRS
jgi:hypothetical protein